MPSEVTLVRSDSSRKTALRGANPGTWEAAEWERLLDGRLDLGHGHPRWRGHLDLPYPGQQRARCRGWGPGPVQGSAARATPRRSPRRGRRSCGQAAAISSTARRARICPPSASPRGSGCARSAGSGSWREFAYRRAVGQGRRILNGPAARAALLRGMDLMTSLLRPTLGPLPRTVAISALVGSQAPEILDSAAIIARRTIQLRGSLRRHGRHARSATWCGGSSIATATARPPRRCWPRRWCTPARGTSPPAAIPVSVRRGMERGLAVAVAALRQQARTIDGPAEIAGVVPGTVRSAELGRDDRRSGRRGRTGRGHPGRRRAGDGRPCTSTSTACAGTRATFRHFCSARTKPRRPGCSTRACWSPITRSTAPSSCCRRWRRASARANATCLIVAPEIRDAAVGLLVVNRERGVLDGVIAVKAPSFGDQRARILEDIAVITGGRCVSQERQDRLADVTIDDLGQARQAWATQVRVRHPGWAGQQSRDSPADRRSQGGAGRDRGRATRHTSDKIKERIGKLAGTAATIRVGAPSRVRARGPEAADRGGGQIGALGGCSDGVVPGGGAALLACIPALEAMAARR